MLKALNYPAFEEKRILVVVAHPDDESLYFFGGLKELTKSSRVTVLCATYGPDSFRGNELKSVCLSLGIECAFLEIEDLGFQTLLPNLSYHFKKYMEKESFDVIITHPPHGGEKPHPHHLQIFLMLFAYSLKNQFKFGFFSESPTSFCTSNKQESLFRLRIFPILLLHSVRTFYLLQRNYKLRWFKAFGKHLLTLSLRLVFESAFFQRYEIAISLSEKRKVLKMYASQRSVLETYKSLSSEREYLFFMTPLGTGFQSFDDPAYGYPLEGYNGSKSFGSSWIGIS